MKKLLLPLFISTLLISCQSTKSDYLIKIEDDTHLGFVNTAGDTIVAMGKYPYSFSDTIRDFGVVATESGQLRGIDGKGNELFEVFMYDNGPDYLADGLFRVIKNGKMGYANTNGKIIIEPRFACAYPFKEGFAKVSDNCTIEKDGEYSRWISEDWYWINKQGERVEK